MDNNQKIDKINAYRKILETKKFPKFDPKADTGVAKTIVMEFEDWVKSQIAALLGEQNPERLSNDEISFLKQFVAKAQQKATAQVSPPPAAAANPQSRITEVPRPNVNAKPLKEGRVKHPSGSLLSELDRMEDRADRRDFD